MNFLERTGLDTLRPEADIKLTIPDGFDRMLEHIAVHRYFMGLDFQRDISEQEAVAHWYDKVYLPIVEVIRRSGILKDFPDKTEAICICGCWTISIIWRKSRASRCNRPTKPRGNL